MIILAFLMMLGMAGLGFAIYQANQVVFSTPIGTLELLGRHAELTAGELFLAGAISGGLVVMCLAILFSRAGRRTRRRTSADLSNARTETITTRENEPTTVS